MVLCCSSTLKRRWSQHMRSVFTKSVARKRWNAKVAIDSYRRCSPRRGRHRSSGAGGPWVVRRGRGSSSSPASSPSDGGHGRRAAEAEDARGGAVAGAAAATRPRRRAADPKDLGSIEHGSAFPPLWPDPERTGGLYVCPFAPPGFHGSSQRTAACSTGSEERRSGLHTRTASGIPISLRLHTSIPPRNFPRKPEPQSERSRARLRRSLVPCGRRNARSSARTRAGPPAPVPLPRGKKFSKSSVGGAACAGLI